MRVYGIPIHNAFYLLNIVVIALTYLTHQPVRKGTVIVYTAAGLYLAALGLLRRDDPLFDIRSALQDVTNYAALPLGIALAQLKGKAGLKQLLRICYLLVAIVFAVNLVLISFGYLESTGTGERQLDLAMFTSDIFICMSFPCVWVSSGPIQKLTAVSGMILCAVFAVTSATRSMFIIFIASLVLTAIVEIKKDGRYLIWISAVIILMTVGAAGGLPGLGTFQNTLLAERLESTDYQREDRYEELSMMLSQMGTTEWIFGSGFGRQFESRIPESGLTAAPHIGVTALLYKGGLPAFVLLIAGPCLLSSFKLLTRRRSTSDPFLAGAAIYLLESCVSGGWAFIALFLLGAFLKLGWEKQVRPIGHRIALTSTPTLSPLARKSREPRAIGNAS